MNLVEPSVELLDIKDPELKLERCMRICYKSEDKITDGSAAKIIKSIVSRGHLSTTEHFRVTMLCDGEIEAAIRSYQDRHNTSFIRIFDRGGDEWSYTLEGNLRAFYEMATSGDFPEFAMYGILHCIRQIAPSMVAHLDKLATVIEYDGIKLAGESGDYFTVKVVTDRGVLGQFVRHRTLSPSVESTRYCNYLNRGISMCLPEPFLWAPCSDIDNWVYKVIDTWFDDPDYETKIRNIYITEDGQLLHRGIVEMIHLAKLQTIWEDSCAIDELMYNRMVMNGAVPQEARTVLPMSHKVEFVMTGTLEAWDKFIKLRDDRAADPQIRIIAEQIKEIKDAYIAKHTKQEEI